MYVILFSTTVNVDIFECINFRGFAEIDNFASIIFAFFTILPLNGIIKVIFT